jgi:hypothetical protein
VLDLLSFPYIFRGALDVQATRITPGMLVAAARALAELAREDVVEEVERAYGKERFTFGPEYLLPKPIDPRILVRESAAVARQAIEEGVARRPLESRAYQESLTVRLGTGRDTLRGMILSARQRRLRVVFSEGTSETILRASSLLVDEGIREVHGTVSRAQGARRGPELRGGPSHARRKGWRRPKPPPQPLPPPGRPDSTPYGFAHPAPPQWKAVEETFGIRWGRYGEVKPDRVPALGPPRSVRLVPLKRVRVRIRAW